MTIRKLTPTLFFVLLLSLETNLSAESHKEFHSAIEPGILTNLSSLVSYAGHDRSIQGLSLNYDRDYYKTRRNSDNPSSPIITLNFGLGFYVIFAENFDKIYESRVPITFGGGAQIKLSNGIIVGADVNYFWENGLFTDENFGLVAAHWKQLMIEFHAGYQAYLGRGEEFYWFASGGPAIFFVSEKGEFITQGFDSETSRTTAGFQARLGTGRFLSNVISVYSYLQFLYATTDSDFGTSVNIGGLSFVARMGFHFPVKPASR
jgi:hypothetical protein